MAHVILVHEGLMGQGLFENLRRRERQSSSRHECREFGRLNDGWGHRSEALSTMFWVFHLLISRSHHEGNVPHRPLTGNRSNLDNVLLGYMLIFLKIQSPRGALKKESLSVSGFFCAKDCALLERPRKETETRHFDPILYVLSLHLTLHCLLIDLPFSLESTFDCFAITHVPYLYTWPPNNKLYEQF